MGGTHLKAWKALPQAELFAVYSRDERKLSGDLSAVEGNFGGPQESFDFSSVAKYTDLEAVLNDPQIEAVDICLPTDLHAEIAVKALRAGKHVLVEKPMALDVKSAQQMIAAAEEHNRILMVAQVLRFFPMYDALRKAVQSPELGKVRSAIFTRRCAAPQWSGWLGNPKLSGGGAFDLLIHDVDICLHLLGKPEQVSAVGYESLSTGADIITAELYYPNSLTVVITGGWHHPKKFPFLMEYTVAMDGGTLDYSSQGRQPTLYSVDGVEQPLPLTEK